MKVAFSNRFFGSGQVVFSSAHCFVRCIMLVFVLNVFSGTAAAQLDPNLPPGGNFDLTYWKLTRPNQQERDADQLSTEVLIQGMSSER